MRNRVAAQEQEANLVARGPLPPEAKLGGIAMWGLDEPPYTLDEAARLLGISRWTALRLFEGEEGVLIIAVLGARRKTRRIPRHVFNRVLSRISQPRSSSPFCPIKYRQPVVHVLEYPQKARKWSEDDRRKQSELMRRVHARKAEERDARATERAANKAQTPRAIPVPLTPN
jgi:hypothetical protein